MVNAAASTLPQAIEIFRAGQHIDDTGAVHNFSQADVAGIVSAYNPALREAPLTIGHPEHNHPAYGWVKALSVNDAGRVAIQTHQVQPQFAEMVASKLFKKRSASFYPPTHPNNPTPGNWYLRHVAFLGAQPPAIAGLADFAESAADSPGAVNFSEEDDEAVTPPSATATATPTVLPTQEQTRMSDIEKQLAAATAKTAEAEAARAAAESDAATAKAKLAEFAEAAQRERTASFTSFAEAQVKAGALPPKDKEVAIAVLGLLADAKPVSFAEAGGTKTVAAVDWLKDLIARAKPLVSFSEQAAGSPGNRSTQGLSDADIDARAHAYATQHKVNYADALQAVVGFTS